MNIQEYYLHMFCGVSGDQDQYSGAGRIAIAALMSGYGLTGSTKRDLQSRINWEVTPGCFLGMKELQDDSYGVRQRPGLKFVTKLLDVKKSARTLNFTLNWNVLNSEDVSFRIDSQIWQVISRIYWMGRFMFARNVIPAEIIALMKSRFSVEYSTERNADLANLYSHHVIQFFTENGFFLDRNLPTWRDGSLLPASAVEAQSRNQPRADLFLSLTTSMNPSENTIGFFSTCAALPFKLPERRSFSDLSSLFDVYDKGRPQADRGYRGAQMGNYYDTYTVGIPSLHYLTRSTFPTSPREITPLLFCDVTMTPVEQAQNNYAPRMGNAVNTQLLDRNLSTYVTGMILFEYHMLLTGQELFPLVELKSIREEKGWSEEDLVGQAPSIYMLSTRNSTVHRLVRFNLERQNRV